ncbi:Vta1 like-domain-containing protein [Glomus cerebriforme]|uniref:Vta1 like-domain-containing protein n=1 Tax=Glomus cerebriforme TaxID=658196 RepID=A0A397SGS4_9GLOM|nr:Vta1 like-domain-containing protein [Glomus cerebriforme]
MDSLPPLPEELKFINPNLQRAQETRKREPVISYYCNYLAAKLALEKGTKSKESKTFLIKLLDMLEQEKKDLADNEAVTDDLVGEAYVDNFSQKVFTMADNEDRAGKATRSTAKTFLAASLYMELLKIFGDISPEIERKIKYAKWKAVDITKALKEGRTPVPGPPGGEPALQQQESEENNQKFPGIDQLPSAQTTSGPTTIVTNPPPSSDNDPFPLFPSAPVHNNSVPNVQDLVSSFEQIDIGKQVAPPLPPKVNDYAGNNINIFDNQFNQQPSQQPLAPEISPPPSANFYDMHQNYQQPSPPQPPSTLPHTGFTNDYAQPHHFQPQPLPQPPPPPQPPHNSFLPSPQTLSQNYIQPANPPLHQQPSFSAPLSSNQNYNMQPYPQLPAEIDPATVGTVQKYCKFANSALDYNDVKTAVDYLNKALEALKPYHK